jgi:hypothetical protein
VEGTVLLLASVDMLKNDFLMQQSRDYQGNIHFFQNALETFGLGKALIEIRRKQLTARQFKEGSEKWTKWITAFSIAGVPVLVAVFGIAYYLKRRRESVAYERRFVQRQ